MKTITDKIKALEYAALLLQDQADELRRIELAAMKAVLSKLSGAGGEAQPRATESPTSGESPPAPVQDSSSEEWLNAGLRAYARSGKDVSE